MGGGSIKNVDHAVVLGVTLDSRGSFVQHAGDIGERAARCFGKVARISSATWGVRFKALKTMYKGTYVATVTYASGVWYNRVGVYPVRSALLRSQRQSLILMTKAYRSVSTMALPVLAGVLPADLQIRVAGEIATNGAGLGKTEAAALKRGVVKRALEVWQERWAGSDDGRDLYCFFPSVSERLRASWIEPDHVTAQMLTGHGCFRGRLRDMSLSETGLCFCGEEDEYRDHVLWVCNMYMEEREYMLDGLERTEAGPVYFADLVRTPANYRLLAGFARDWFKKRGPMEIG